MKYWAYLAGKLAVVGAISAGFYKLAHWAVALRFNLANVDDLRGQFVWAFTLFVLGLISAGLAWLAVLDQKYRCRTCLHKLRMPVATGEWDKAILFSRPKMEWICPYGHGTMNVPQVQLLGPENVEWAEHADIWKELESIGAGDRR
jgi:hypothetical protein